MKKRGNRKGLSSVLVVLTIISISLIIIGLIWLVARNIVETEVEEIELEKFTPDLEIKNVKVEGDNVTVDVVFKRNPEKGEFVGINFVFSYGNNIEVIREDTLLNELEEKSFTYTLTKIRTGKLEGVSIAPIYKLLSGEEDIKNVAYTYNVETGQKGVVDEVCGNAILESGEQCDDGNILNGDGCSSICEIESRDPVCGNGILEIGEQCDDANTVNRDGCSSICQTEAGLECVFTNAYWNTNNLVENDIVTLTLEGTGCNGQLVNFKVLENDLLSADTPVKINPKSKTFIGNTTTTTWTVEYQKDGFTDPEYYFIATLSSDTNTKIDSGTSDAKLLKASLYVEICGNAILESGEQCDDGNILNGDGCSSVCKIEAAQQADMAPLVNPMAAYGFEDSGSVASDSSANKNDGTLINGPVWTTGKHGNGLSFDGLNDYVEISHVPDYLMDDGTIEFWFRTSDLSSNKGMLSKDSTGFDTGGHLSISTTSNSEVEVRLQSTTTSFTVTSDPIISLNTWYHVAFTFGSGGMKLYINGANPKTNGYTGGLGTASGGKGNFEPLGVGATTWLSDNLIITPTKNHFKGKIDEIQIYNKALTQSEIQADMNTPISSPGQEPICGNAILESGEQCDDGNLINSDGCSSICEIESPPPVAVNMGPLVVHPTNPRYFADGNGNVVYLTGSHGWTNFQDCSSSTSPKIFDYSGYMTFMEQRNHNFIRLWAWENPLFDPSGSWLLGDPTNCEPMPFMRTGPGNAADGKPKFDLTKFNQAYFDRLRNRVIQSKDKNIYVGIMLFEGFSTNLQTNFDAWSFHPFNSANNINGINGDPDGSGDGLEVHTLTVNPAILNIQKNYVKKVIDTVNDLDNVLYEICNECKRDSKDWHYEIINYIKQYESNKPKQHPVGMTGYYNPLKGSSGQIDYEQSPAEWISRGAIVKWSDLNEPYLSNHPIANGKKVDILDTDHLGAGIFQNDGNFGRQWTWKSFIRGYNPILMEPLPTSISHYGTNNLWNGNDPDWDSTRDAMGHTKTYADKMNLASMTPQNNLASTSYVLANPGSEYLIYQPGSGSFTVTLQSGTYSYEWFNPSSGTIINTGTITAGSGNRAFNPSFSGDAVLYLRRA